MTQLCITALAIAIIYNITHVVIKKMELSYMDRKNQKEGKPDYKIIAIRPYRKPYMELEKI